MLKNKIRVILKKTFIGNIYYFFKSAKVTADDYVKWIYKKKPVPPPDCVKQKIVKKYARKFNIKVLIETGTCLGKMVDNCKAVFYKIYSIELGMELFQNAKTKFDKYSHIRILHGDSSIVLQDVLKNIDEPALFWLDGHYSEGITAKGELNTPIVQELTHIFNHAEKKHVILIDDARCFIGKDDYPTLSELNNLMKNISNYKNFMVENDIIRIY